MSRNNFNMVNVENSNWRKVVMPKKMHFIWKTNVSEINNCGLLRSFREITALGIPTPFLVSTLAIKHEASPSFYGASKFQSQLRKNGGGRYAGLH